jgi:MFS family permease
MKKFRWYDHITVNLLWLAINIRNNAIGSLFLPYLVDQFVRGDIKNTALGGLRTAGLIVAMLAQPVFGLLSDRSTSRFGRRRPYFFFGFLLDLLFLAGIYFAWDYPTLVIALLLQQVSANLSHGPLQALIPDLVPESQRGVSSGVKAIFELVPLILVGYTIAGLVSQGHYDWAVLVTGAGTFGIMLLSIFLVKETPQIEKPDIPFWPPMLRVLGMLAGILAGAVAGIASGAVLGGVIGLVTWPLFGERIARISGVGAAGLTAMVVAVAAGVWAGVRATLGRKIGKKPVERAPFTWWVVNRLYFLAAITSLQSFAPYFFMFAFHINREEAVGLTGSLLTMVGLFTLATALPGGWISDRFGHRQVIAGSGVVAAIGSFALLSTLWFPSITLVYVIGAVLGLATGMFMAANWAFGTSLVPTEEAGRYLGISNLAGAGAGIIGAGLGGPVADYVNGIIPGMGYFILFGCYGVLFLLSTLSLKGIPAGENVKILPAAAEAGSGQSPA